ncbi:MAG: RNA polymerase sigma factor [Polyangiaceae bacterium]
MPTTRGELEDLVRSRCGARDYDAAATAAIRGYGPEIFSLVSALHGNDDDAADVFAMFSEALWRGLPKFEWQCSLRTWAYIIARNASHRVRKLARRHGHHVTLQDSAVARVAQEVRTTTLSYLRSAQRDRLAALRDALSEDDKTLLVLRLDRGLAWDELARVMRGADGAADESELKRESARLRKRFQLVKERLVALGKKQGLIKPLKPSV